MMRLQKAIAQAGVTSRRKAEELILTGKVQVNGQVVTTLGAKVDPRTDIITVSGKRIIVSPKKVYYALNKPVGYITSLKDPQGRATVMDLLPPIATRIFPIGRLDYNSEGLLLLTNDGQLAYYLTHPRFKVKKTYRVLVKGFFGDEDAAKLRAGVELEDGKTAPARVTILKRTPTYSWLEITIHEGRKREIRRMCASVEHPVLKLKRIEFAGILLGKLPVGHYRPLTSLEILKLKNLVRTASGHLPPPPKPSSSF
ncbi:MAG: rRNA pseudouridine synthase [Clostridia bacterium]|nr:rRNA pseudouridine synthase [Clostridia bacterium]